jgi:hypothetical protein
MEWIGERGLPLTREAVKHLADGIWEFRHGHHRIAYFDTGGEGAYDPKSRYDDRRLVDPRNEQSYWWYPDMDPILRLTNAWSKQSQKTPPHEIELARTIRGEDVEHDRRSEDGG